MYAVSRTAGARLPLQQEWKMFGMIVAMDREAYIYGGVYQEGRFNEIH